MSEHLKWLLASDIHFPKHDKRAVELFLKVAKAWQPDAIDLAGDIDDAECTSRWVEGTPKENISVKSGAEPTREFLMELSQICPKAEDKHFHGGNHDFYRHKKYFEKNAPNTLDYLTPDVLYGLTNSGFQWHNYEQPPVKRYGDYYVHHGESISKHSGESVRNDVQNYMVSLIRGHCFSEDTEVLTPTGWKNYTEITQDSMVMTLNRETNKGEWNQVEEKFVYDDFKELISVEAHGLDLLVTPGHGLWTSPNLKKLKFEETTAKESFGKETVFPLALEHDEFGIDLTDDQIRFIGDVIRRNAIFSSNDALLYLEEDWLENYLHQDNSIIDDALRGMSLRQIRVMMDCLVPLFSFCTIRKDYLDFVQELAVRSGRSSYSEYSEYEGWELSVYDDSVVVTRNWNRESYDGKVWCVQVNNGTLVVRRNGKTAITLNSHRLGSYFKTYPLPGIEVEGYELGHMTDPKLHTYQTVHDWQLGFMVLHVYDGVVHPELKVIRDYSVTIDGKLFKA